MSISRLQLRLGTFFLELLFLFASSVTWFVKMQSLPPPAYKDAEYQSVHYNLFKDSITVPLQRVLPPGLTQYAFEAAIMQYMAVVGHEQVLRGDALTEYIDPYELQEAEGQRKIPSAAVRPKNVEELQKVLAISNEYAIPVWTFSRGKNLGSVQSFVLCSS